MCAAGPVRGPEWSNLARSSRTRKTAAIDPELRRLLDEQAIHRRLIDYCRGIDRLDADLVASVYHPDGTDDHGSFKGLGVDFAQHVIGRIADRYESTMHTCGNPHIEFSDADAALVESHVCARHVAQQDGRTVLVTFGGRYVDNFERRDGEWKIAHRTVVHEWDKVEPMQSWFPTDQFTRGRRDRSDLSYPAR